MNSAVAPCCARHDSCFQVILSTAPGERLGSETRRCHGLHETCGVELQAPCRRRDTLCIVCLQTRKPTCELKAFNGAQCVRNKHLSCLATAAENC